MKLFHLFSLVLIMALILSPSKLALSASDKTFTVRVVTDTLDANPGDGKCADAKGNCSLRAAVMETNALPGPDSITLPKNTYKLTITGVNENSAEKGDLDITDDLEITGYRHYNTFVDGKDLGDRLFHITDSAVVSITNVTVRNGDHDFKGGGIHNEGVLALIESSVNNNRTIDDGGGISTSGSNAKLVLIDSSVSRNISGDEGGGISSTGRSITISGSTIGNNDAEFSGGGIFVRGDSLSGTNNTINDNEADEGGGIFLGSNSKLDLSNTEIINNNADEYGGGILNRGDSYLSKSTLSGNESDDGGGIYNNGTFILVQSTINSNSANDRGGGIYTQEIMTIVNSTISGNLTQDSGGGIYISLGKMDLYNTTIVDNRANTDWDGAQDGGGIKHTAGQVNLYDTILSLNVHADKNGFAIDDDCSGTLDLLSYSLLTTTTGCNFSSVNSSTGLNPKLGPLADNGGPTKTHALLDDSPAIDAGDPDGCKDQDGKLLTADQRGYPRPFDGDENNSVICDIGAYEFVNFLPYSYLPILKK